MDAFVNDQSPRKANETPASVSMICNILNFLDASPMTLFEGPPKDPVDRDTFFLENFESIVACVLAPNESIRRLAVAVAKRLLADEVVLLALKGSKAFDSQELKFRFWCLRYVFM